MLLHRKSSINGAEADYLPQAYEDRTHMDVDTIHAAIERAKRISTTDIEIPHDWAIFISAIRRSIPFKVYELEQKCFLAFKALEQRYTIPKTSTDGNPVRFKDIMMFEYSTEAPGQVSYKYDLEQERAEVMQVVQKKAVIMESIELEPLNNAPLSLPDAKLSDLRGLLPYIRQKEYYQTFLKTLVPTKRGRKAKSNVLDDFENDMDFEEDV